MKINIEGLNKVKLVKALYDAALPTDKTDLSKEISDKDIKKFLDKDRKINIINGKNIKVDTGRSKLSSGVYDKFNGEYSAVKAIYNLKMNYKLYIILDKTLEETINELKRVSELSDNLLYTIFNGHYLYSDNLNLEYIVKSFYDIDLDKYNSSKISNITCDFNSCEVAYNKKINNLIDYYYALSVDFIDINLRDNWKADLARYIPKSLFGIEIDAFIYIISRLKDNDINIIINEVYNKILISTANLALLYDAVDKYIPNNYKEHIHTKLLIGG